MIKLFKCVKPYWKTVILVVLILFVQAYCDLSLPAYTSDIVNVGIQQGGVDDLVPTRIAKEDMDKVILFISTEDQKTVLDSYEEDTDTYDKAAYVIKQDVSKDDEKMENLADIMAEPMMLTAGFESGSDTTNQMQEQIMGNIPEGMLPEGATIFDVMKVLPEQQKSQLLEKVDEQMADMPDTITDQAAISYVKSVYENLGTDMDTLQINYLLTTGGKMLALAFLGMLASVCVGLLASRVGASTGRDLRGSVFRKVVGFSNGEFDKFSTASLITRSTNDIQQIQMLIVMLLRLVLYAPILALGGLYKVFTTNASMSWIIGLAVILVVIVVVILFTVAMPKFKVLQTLVDKLNLVTREILTGLDVIRAFSTEKHEEERFDMANKDLTRTNLFVNRAMTFMMPVMMLIMNGITVLIIWTGAHGVDEGQMQVGDMMAFMQYAMQIIMGFLMLCMISIMLPRAAVAAGRVDEVITSRTLIHDPKQPKTLPADGKGKVVFDHVSFRYPGAEEDVLHDISFTANPGETTAIIGSTGSGKSTLINLIPRFYDVTEGTITLDGVNICDITQYELRDKLGYVPQKGVLFSGTIATNILYGKEDGSIADMERAADIAQAVEFIDSKKEKYDSAIAQGGGQRIRWTEAEAIHCKGNCKGAKSIYI